MDDLQRLAQMVESSILFHVHVWRLSAAKSHNEHEISEPFDPDILPEWLMMFGIAYSHDALAIIAHIPFKNPHAETKNYRDWWYLSCVVDTIELAGISNKSLSPGTAIINNIKSSLALFTLQRHAHKMQLLWDELPPPDSDEGSGGPDRPRSPSRSPSPDAS